VLSLRPFCLRPDPFAAVLHTDFRKSGGGRGPQQKGQVPVAIRWRRHQDGRTRRRSRCAARQTPAAGGKHISLAISSAAAARGLRGLYRGPEQPYLDKPLYEYLKTSVFEGDRLWDIYKLPLLFGFLSLLAQLPLSIRKDIKRRKQMKYGRLLKGPVLLTPKEFNETVQGDGIGFKTTEAKEMMRIPLRAEAQHIELMGDTGAGKTSLIMQILRQIQDRDEMALVYDPACEFIQRFYNANRGDIVLNPLDARCPYLGAV